MNYLLDRYWYGTETAEESSEEEEEAKLSDIENNELQEFDPSEVGLQQEELDEMFIDMLVR
jgi:hypothetical protein